MLSRFAGGWTLGRFHSDSGWSAGRYAFSPSARSALNVRHWRTAPLRSPSLRSKLPRSRLLSASYQNHPLVSRLSSTSSMAHSISAASARFRGLYRSALLLSTDAASIFTADW